MQCNDDRLVCGLRDESLQKRLLSNDKVTLKIAQEEAIASEEAALKTPVNQQEINRIGNGGEKKSKAKNQSRDCFRCGGTHSPDQCRFKNVDCH